MLRGVAIQTQISKMNIYGRVFLVKSWERKRGDSLYYFESYFITSRISLNFIPTRHHETHPVILR
jgi:hypothetical protein